MHRKRNIAAAVMLGALLIGCSMIPRTHAEVSAEVDSFDNYVRTVIFTNASAKKLKIWSARNYPPNRVPLNPGGDANGDLRPVIVESSTDMNHPWAVWSRWNGSEYDLAWSRWGWDGAWEPIAWVEQAPSRAGDDLEPSITLDPVGRPYMAWWRNEGGHGRIYFSVFLSTRWMDPIPVSDSAVDSRSPAISFQGSAIRVAYRTPNGPRYTDIVFAMPDTINDDITPFGNMVVGEPEGGSNEMGQ